MRDCDRLEAVLSILDLERLDRTPLERDPFDFVVVDGFLRPEAVASVLADFPQVPGHGSYPAGTLAGGPAFADLLRAVEGDGLRLAITRKFGVDLDGRPTMVTVRGHSDPKDGRIHTDSATKIITLLLYLNPVWDCPEGRLRLLRSGQDLEDYAVEVPPLAGTMLAFRRSTTSFHGHHPCPPGPRRSLQLNWVTDAGVVRRELARHRWSARWKALNPFARAAAIPPVG